MLSYQHGYHAGNFADVVKHFTLSRILNYLCQKEKPIFYLETHAGRGIYDLSASEALKTGEAHLGIEKLWQVQTQLPDLFRPYLDTIRHYNESDKLRYYPGSPLFAMSQLRAQDRLYCCELHPREFEHLKNLRRHQQDMKVHFSHSDGLLQLTALLPPPERRGLIFIDPSYEIKTEYRRIPEIVQAAYRTFSSGVFCVWYPIVDKKWRDQIVNGLSKIGDKNLSIEFHYMDSKNGGMTGCGLWVINAPYVLAAELRSVLPLMVKHLNSGKATYEMNAS